MKMFIAIFIGVLLLYLIPASALAADCDKAKGLIEEGNHVISSNPSRAEGLYREAVRLCPDSASAHYNLGLARYRRGDFASASSSFKEAIDLKPESVEAMNGLALSYASQGIRYKESRALIEKALSIRPGDQRLKEALKIVEASRVPPYIIADLIVEDSNGNQILDAGEDVTFRVVVENKGKGKASGIKADINAPDFLNIGSSRLGNIMPGERKEHVMRTRIPYTVKTGEYVIKVSVIEESGRYGAVPIEITLPVRSPVPPRFAVRARIDDDLAGHSSGNGNGRIEKGETIEVHLNIRNEGEGVARSVVATLKPKSSGIDLPVPEAKFGNIPPNSSVKGVLTFAVPWTFQGEELSVEILIEEMTGIFTASILQDFPVYAEIEKKRIGASLTPEERRMTQVEFTFETPSVKESVRLSDKVHELKFKKGERNRNYYALVIGIEKYRDIKTDALYAANDAEWVAWGYQGQT